MSKTSARTANFLQALVEPAHVTIEAPAASRAERRPARAGAREGKKHIGAYFDLVEDAEVIEQFARLRARLRLDNSGLVRLMIDETFRRHEAKRAFGDV